MRISEAEAKRRLESPNNLCAIVKHVTGSRSRKEGDRSPNIPEFLREVIAEVAVTPGVKAVDIAREFSVDPTTVTHSKNGNVGGNSGPINQERMTAAKLRQQGVRDTALIKLMASLDLIQDEDMKECKPKELSIIAKNLASVHKSLEESQAQVQQNTQFIIYSPEIKSEKEFKTIDV